MKEIADIFVYSRDYYLFSKFHKNSLNYSSEVFIIAEYTKTSYIDGNMYSFIKKYNMLISEDNQKVFVRTIIYKKNDVLHRISGPALIKYDKTGNNIISKCWYRDGKTHCYFNPSIIESFLNVYRSHCFWIFDEHDKTNEIENWLKENNIILSEENDYEIPDDYKAEFKLLFY